MTERHQDGDSVTALGSFRLAWQSQADLDALEMPIGSITDLFQADELDAGEGQHPGLSPHLQRVASLLGKLARAGRSFNLYDPGNEAIRNFISNLLEGFVSILDQDGELLLNIQPFEIRCEGVPVYSNPDRERSLAFRLYRDGVRTLVFLKGFHWKELTRLLEILSIRYTGIHQFEDDVVTLLWRAGFAHLDVLAVEGFLSAEEADGIEFEVSMAAGSGQNPLEEVSRSLSVIAAHSATLDALSHDTPVHEWLSVPTRTLTSLRAEVSEESIPHEAIALLRRLRQHMSDPVARLPYEEVRHLFFEVRDFLLRTEHLSAFKRFVTLVWDLQHEAAPTWDPDRTQLLRQTLESCGEPARLIQLLRTIPRDERMLPEGLFEVLDMVCPDPLAPALEALCYEDEPSTRAIARQLLERYARDRPDYLLQRFEEAQGSVSCDLLRVLGRIAGDDVATMMAVQCSNSDPQVQVEAVTQLERMAYSAAVGRALVEALGRIGSDLRGRIIQAMANSGDHRFVTHMTRFVEERSADLDLPSAAAMGKVMGRFSGPESLSQWEDWLKPRGLIRRLMPSSVPKQVAAAMALSELPGDRPAQVLRRALVAADTDVYEWIGQALSHQRQGTRGAAS